ncbi:MAG: tRNA nucleotidyltransferase, partial [Clostridiales Family XIII bacterium]|nr:tRNA nucleotidyltransferase [Clostridiales Family XIII bacterium]
MQIPLHADMIMKELSAHGHQAYAVGGCVRDSLLGLIPHDWDICTSATPGQVCECLSGRWRISATGIRHGSVTASADGVPPIEITSFRADGSYSDSRHPDQVRFVKSLRVDLARRDFTMNALAYAPDAGLIDYFGGESDLRAGLIRAIGDPSTRFQEDALRIMRALRFAATYSFELETGTAAAARAHAGRLAVIAPERIKPEFFKLLAGAGAAAALSTCPSAITAFLPEILPLLPETG